MMRRCFKPWDIFRAQGFTLIELAIVLAILGLLLGGASMLLQPVLDNNKRTETRARLKSIEDALTIYAATNFDLPCPSNPALGPGSALNGVEANPVTVCNAGANPMASGGVPWQTLGLSEADVLDGWGRRISYAVTGNLADATGAPPATAPLNCPANGFSLILRGKLENRGANNAAIGAAALGAADAARAAYVLISHGENGVGGYLRSGAQTPDTLPSSTSVTELGNIKTVGANAAAQVIFHYEKLAAGDAIVGFDDIVRSRTSGQIAISYGCNTP
ncbi:MAG: prepilin-type N-terminal cleavage/methylation domain-containing protein [Alphaproteobacteria bacterium]